MDESDIAQAAEKAWGAVSAFANIYSIAFHGKEVTANKNKREVLKEFLDEVKEHDLEVKELLIKEYKGHTETLIGALAGLHRFFFGGTDIKDEDVKRYLKHSFMLLPILQEYSQIISEYYLEQNT